MSNKIVRRKLITLTASELEDLRCTIAWYDPPKLRPRAEFSFAANKRTHERQLRNGLIYEDAEGYVHPTVLGLKMAGDMTMWLARKQRH